MTSMTWVILWNLKYYMSNVSPNNSGGTGREGSDENILFTLIDHLNEINFTHKVRVNAQ